MTLILKSIEEEAADCRARCANLKVGDLVLHLHHTILMEILTEPLENRILYILKEKSDNVALRLRMISPVLEDEISLADAEYSKARAELSKARAEYSKAYAEYSKARAEYSKAYAEYSKADAEYSKADAEYCKAYAEYSKADAEYCKAYAEYSKADAEYSKANAELSKAYAPHYSRLFPDSPWNGKTIFAGEFAPQNNYGVVRTAV